MHIGLFLDVRGDIISHVSLCRIFILLYLAIDLVSLFVKEKPLWGITNKVCMFVCNLIRKWLFVFPYNFCFPQRVISRARPTLNLPCISPQNSVTCNGEYRRPVIMAQTYFPRCRN